MRLFDRFRRPAPAADPAARRHFFRRMSGVGLAVAAAGTLGADEAWAAVEERANRLGIVPGTVVDAQGRRVRRSRLGIDPFIGEIMIAGFNFAPQGYALCNRQLISIAQNSALFSLLGTTFGGNGQTTFALPNLQGRVPVGQGNGGGLQPKTMGEMAGAESTTLSIGQMPAHVHAATSSIPVSSAPGTTPNPVGALIAQPASSIPQYVASGTVTDGSIPATTTVDIAGGSQPHSVRDPYLVMNYCIATQGIFPSRP